MSESRSVVAWAKGRVGDWLQRSKEGIFSDVIEILCILIVVVTWEHISIKTHQTVHLFFNVFIYLFLLVRGLHFCLGCSLVVASRGYSSCRARSRMHGLRYPQQAGSVVRAHRLWSTGSIVAAHRLSCPAACGIFPDQGWNPCLLHWQADFLPLNHQGSPNCAFKQKHFVKNQV